ncbi:MAG: response regulator [Brevundimonas sp.]|nr:MAG: response regulator [Brevundimonas sp.]
MPDGGLCAPLWRHRPDRRSQRAWRRCGGRSSRHASSEARLRQPLRLHKAAGALGLSRSVERESPLARILVAEDDADIRDFLAVVLTGAGHEVTPVADGAEVLTRLAFPPPSMVLIDLHMPGLSGLDALKQIRTVPAWGKVPVVFLTASGATDDMVRARTLGAQGYLVKPIRSVDLLAKIRVVLEDRSLIWLDDITQSRSA